MINKPWVPFRVKLQRPSRLLVSFDKASCCVFTHISKKSTITDGKLTLIGYKQVIFREDDLTEISPSNLNVEEIAFKIEKREAIDGEIVDALVFADSLRFMSDSQYGLVSKDVNRFGNYRKLKELLSSGIDEQ